MHQQDRPLFPGVWATGTVAYGPSFQNRCESTDDNSRVCCSVETEPGSSLRESATDHWYQTGSAETTLQQTNAWGYYGTIKREYQEVASSMDWPILCHQEAVRQYLMDPATSGTSQTSSGSFQSVETLW